MQDINEVIRDNKGLVYKQLHKFYLVDDPEAESFAYEALMNAANTFQEEQGFKFSTYASVCIYNALGCYVRKLNKKRQLQVFSYNQVAYSDENGDHEHLEYIPSTRQVDDDIMRKELIEVTKLEINNLIASMPNATQQCIMKAYVASEYEKSSRDLGIEFGVSQSYASQVINIFKGKLKKRMEAYYNA